MKILPIFVAPAVFGLIFLEFQYICFSSFIQY